MNGEVGCEITCEGICTIQKKIPWRQHAIFKHINANYEQYSLV